MIIPSREISMYPRCATVNARQTAVQSHGYFLYDLIVPRASSRRVTSRRGVRIGMKIICDPHFVTRHAFIGRLHSRRLNTPTRRHTTRFEGIHESNQIPSMRWRRSRSMRRRYGTLSAREPGSNAFPKSHGHARVWGVSLKS